jgi:hypothetical protein
LFLCFQTTEYICHRGPQLKRILLLLDARHGFKHADTLYFNQLVADANKLNPNKRPHWKLQVVLTKGDMIPRQELARRVMVVRNHISEKLHGLALSNLPVVVVSGHERRGIIQLQRELAALVPALPPQKDPTPAPSADAGGSDSGGSIDTEDSKVSEKKKVDKKKVAGKASVGRLSSGARAAEDEDSVDDEDDDASPSSQESMLQRVDRSLARQEREAANGTPVKIAVGLRPIKSVITQPKMDQYLASLAPVAEGGTVSLTMSDRLDAILNHHAGLLKNSNKEKEDAAAATAAAASAATKAAATAAAAAAKTNRDAEWMAVQRKGMEEDTGTDDTTADVSSFLNHHYANSNKEKDAAVAAAENKVNEADVPTISNRFEISKNNVKMNQKTGMFTPPGAGAKPKFVGRVLSEEELKHKMEKKNSYKTRYGGKAEDREER